MERQQLLRTQLPTQTDNKWFCCWGSGLMYRCRDNPGKVSHACPRASPQKGSDLCLWGAQGLLAGSPSPLSRGPQRGLAPG